jgi:release factor glutamine methyltransferase
VNTSPATVAALLGAAQRALADSASARLDAELLLGAASGLARSDLYRAPEHVIDVTAQARFAAFVDRRASGEPIAYIVGKCEFWSLPFTITPDVLVPRAETELVVETVLAEWPRQRPAVVLDLGTGSGAIAAALAHERCEFALLASDLSGAALAVATANCQRLGVNVACYRGDWLAAVGGAALDIIVANPPYVGHNYAVDAAVMHEPRVAVFAANDGLAALACIIGDARRCLRAGGLIVLEHGHAQAARVRALCAHVGLNRTLSVRDLAGHERVTCARAP